MEKICLSVLKGFNFEEEITEDGPRFKIVGDHIGAIRDTFPDKKQAGLAMKFVSFRLKIAETDGPEVAL